MPSKRHLLQKCLSYFRIFLSLVAKNQGIGFMRLAFPPWEFNVSKLMLLRLDFIASKKMKCNVTGGERSKPSRSSSLNTYALI